MRQDYHCSSLSRPSQLAKIDPRFRTMNARSRQALPTLSPRCDTRRVTGVLFLIIKNSKGELLLLVYCVHVNIAYVRHQERQKSSNDNFPFLDQSQITEDFRTINSDRLVRNASIRPTLLPAVADSDSCVNLSKGRLSIATMTVL